MMMKSLSAAAITLLPLSAARDVAYPHIYWDCGSSGSNAQLMTSPTEFIKFVAKNEKNGATGCTVSQAFMNMEDVQASELAAANPCKAKYDALAAAMKAHKHFPSATGQPVGEADVPGFEAGVDVEAVAQPAAEQARLPLCWAAGTAGNRLIDKETDKTSWANFKSWNTAKGLCTFPETPAVGSVLTSYTGTLTIPGVTEAALEVEQITKEGLVIAKNGQDEDGNPLDEGDGMEGVASTPALPGGAVAFASAGGSSAQFGLLLHTKECEGLWEDVRGRNLDFREKNFPSAIDTTNNHYLNTYISSAGQMWAVGSFLGSDNDPSPAKGNRKTTSGTPYVEGTTSDDQLMDLKQRYTPIGGIGAMGFGLDSYCEIEGTGEDGFMRTDGPKLHAVDLSSAQMSVAMAHSQQGSFANEFKDFATACYPDLLTTPGRVVFVAKTSLVETDVDEDRFGFNRPPSVIREGLDEVEKQGETLKEMRANPEDVRTFGSEAGEQVGSEPDVIELKNKWVLKLVEKAERSKDLVQAKKFITHLDTQGDTQLIDGNYGDKAAKAACAYLRILGLWPSPKALAAMTPLGEHGWLNHAGLVGLTAKFGTFQLPLDVSLSLEQKQEELPVLLDLKSDVASLTKEGSSFMQKENQPAKPFWDPFMWGWAMWWPWMWMW